MWCGDVLECGVVMCGNVVVGMCENVVCGDVWDVGMFYHGMKTWYDGGVV